MTARDQYLADADPVTQAQRLCKLGDPIAATRLIDQVLPQLNPYDRARALIVRVIAVYNLGPADELFGVVDAAFEAVRGRPEPYLHGHLYALAALAAHRRGALEQSVTYLVLSARALKAMETDTEVAAYGWYDLAMAYSYIGFHGYAITAHERSVRAGWVAGVPASMLAAPGVRLRGAVLHDHQGDSQTCAHILRSLVTEFRGHVASGLIEQMRPAAQVGWAYAVARLAALGDAVDIDPRRFLRYGGGATRPKDLATLGRVCTAIGEGRPYEALNQLDAINVSAESLGPGEVARLRALAYVRAGEFHRAYEADRESFREASARGEQLREAVVEGIAARLDHEDLRRRVDKYVDEALTDPLTRLPNRRHLEQYVTAMVKNGGHAVVGVCDMDGFKMVNTVHGHLAGDHVLERVGQIIHQVLRRGDFLARYGGDEFVVVLPRTTVDEAGDIAERIVAAVREADWSSLAPGTPVAVSVGWAEVAGPRMELNQVLGEAFEAADRAMLTAKTRSRARAS